MGLHPWFGEGGPVGSWWEWAFSCGVAWVLQVHLDSAEEYTSLELACG